MSLRSLLLTKLAAMAFVLVFALPAVPQSAAPAAQGPLYNVEIVIFRATTALGRGENWSLETRNPGIAANAGSPQGERLVGALPPARFQLNDVVTRLRANGNYEPVAHAAWTQTASSWGTRAGIPIEQLGIAVPGLTGSVLLERGQYLHLGLSLTYAMESPPAGIGAGPNTVFTLNDLRRVRFNERHYFDHPAFGAIAIVTPVR